MVFRETTIEWNGKKLTFVPSNKLIRRIDRELRPETSVMGVANELSGLADPKTGMIDLSLLPLPDLAFIFSMFLDAGGAEPEDKADEDSVYWALWNDMTKHQGANALIPLTQLFLTTVMPSAETLGKSNGGPKSSPNSSAKPRKKKAKSRAA